MSTFPMTLPLRRGPVRNSRRDLAVDPGEDALLQLTIVDTDAEDGSPVDLNAIANSKLVLNVWYHSTAWDYGYPAYSGYGTCLLWSVDGFIFPAPPGRVNVTIPQGAIAGWRGHLDWSAQLTYGTLHYTVMRGAINVHV